MISKYKKCFITFNPEFLKKAYRPSCKISANFCPSLTLTLLTWRIWWSPNNANRWQMGFNSAFKGLKYPLTLTLLTWRIWWAPNYASRWQMGFNLAFKGLKCPLTLILLTWRIWWSRNNARRCLMELNSEFKDLKCPLTLILLTWRIWWAANNTSKWQMGFNSAFKGLIKIGMYRKFSWGILTRNFTKIPASVIKLFLREREEKPRESSRCSFHNISVQKCYKSSLRPNKGYVTFDPLKEGQILQTFRLLTIFSWSIMVTSYLIVYVGPRRASWGLSGGCTQGSG